MLSRIGKRVSYTNIVMTLILVFVMTGGAYAANKYVITSAKQIKPSVLNSLRGKAGPAGPGGAQGSQGAQGPAGAVGPQGPQGGEGKAGMGETGKEGKAGANGKDGSPWTVGGLPKGASERGTWSISGFYKQGEGFIFVPISFSVPLTAPLGAERVHYIGAGEGEGEAKEALAVTEHECEGTFKAPKAKSGNLCVFLSVAGGELGIGEISARPGIDTMEEPGTEGAGISGAYLSAGPVVKTEGAILAAGNWVVTG